MEGPTTRQQLESTLRDQNTTDLASKERRVWTACIGVPIDMKLMVQEEPKERFKTTHSLSTETNNQLKSTIETKCTIKPKDPNVIK